MDFKEFLDLAYRDVVSSYEGGSSIKGVRTGYPDLDELTGGFRAGTLVIIGGATSMGKSALAVNFALNILRQGYNVGFFSLEMTGKSIAGRVLSMESKVPSKKLDRVTPLDTTLNKLTTAKESLEKLNYYINDSVFSIQKIKEIARDWVNNKGVRVLFVDYLQLVFSQRKESRNLEVGSIAQELKGLAKELRVPVISVSQLSRLVSTRDDHKPKLSDLRDSGELEQTADIVMFVYRPIYYSPTGAQNPNEGLVMVPKNRDGLTGEVRLEYNQNLTLFR